MFGCQCLEAGQVFPAEVADVALVGVRRTDTSADAQATHLLLMFEGLLVLARSGATDLMNGMDLSLSAVRP